MKIRERLKDKKRVVIKIGSSSLTHAETGKLDLTKLEILVTCIIREKMWFWFPLAPLQWDGLPWELPISLPNFLKNRPAQPLDRRDS